MRLSDAGLRRRPTELIYRNHRPPPWLTEDASRDRSNRLLGIACLKAELAAISALDGGDMSLVCCPSDSPRLLTRKVL
jgi:hypothetical protein